MKKILTTLFAALLAIIIIVPAPSAVAEDNNNDHFEFSSQLQLGARGDAVKVLQGILAADQDTGFSATNITGNFGQLTKQAVKKFQQKHGVMLAGRVGPQTISIINSILAAHPEYIKMNTNGSLCFQLPTDQTCLFTIPPGILRQLGAGNGGTIMRSDVTPPVITSATVQAVAPTSATIAIQTNEPTEGEVLYGTTSAYGSTTGRTTLALRNYTQIINGLSANTTYHFQVKVMDPSTNTTVGNDMTFTTTVADTNPPTISAVTIIDVGQNRATLFWITNKLTTTNILYGTTTAYGTVASDASLSIIHYKTIINLATGTTYHFQIQAKDQSGNVTNSNDVTFTTKGITPDVLPPVVSSLNVSAVTATNATINFNTNELTTTRLYYTTATPVIKSAATIVADVSLTSTHTTTIAGLSANTTYHYLVEATDAAGNVTTATEGSFTTGG